MFRPNRIGTPVIHGSEDVQSVLDIPLSLVGNSALLAGNAINATPVLDFGRSALNWIGGAAENIPNGNKYGFLQQVTITEPLAGDTVGIELNAAITYIGLPSDMVRPVFMKTTGAVALLAALTLSGQPTDLAPGKVELAGNNSLAIRQFAYKQQVIIRNTAGVAGNYAHGFHIHNNSGAAYGLLSFNMVASVRQLNDQQDVTYRDTLR